MLSTRPPSITLIAAVVVLASSPVALAANPPLTSSNYAIDVFQGPVLAPVRAWPGRTPPSRRASRASA
jgi:hypothetical protein